MISFKINGVDAPAGAIIKPQINDLDGNAERNAAGDMRRDRKAIKRGISVTYPIITQEDSSIFLEMIEPVNFNCTYPDPRYGIVTKTMYSGPREAELVRWDDNLKLWRNLTVDFVEV